MGIFQAIILGIVQGLTEFLPVSSSAHIRLVSTALGWEDPGAPFTASIQLGTIAAVIIYFRKDLAYAFKGWMRSFSKKSFSLDDGAKLGWAIAIGTLPICILGLIFKDIIEKNCRSLYVIAFSLIGLALVLALTERIAKKNKGFEQINVKTGLLMGLWQTLSLIPGMSRSGSTITGALFAGFNSETAARFSFLLSVPAIVLAAGFSLKTHAEFLLGNLLVPMLIANLFSFGIGFLAINFLMQYLHRHSIMIFVYYRLCIGILILFLLNKGFLTP